MTYGTYIDTGTVRHERLLPGPIQRVWSYLTEDPQLGTWLGHATIPPRSGEAFTLTFTHCGETPDADEEPAVMHGETRTYDPYGLLEYVWREEGREELVRFELAPQGDRVRLVLTHSRLAPSIAAKVGPGWHVHLDVLEAQLTGGPLFPFFERYEALQPAYAAKLTALGASEAVR